ncbi:hypothetical protein K439DRAFT_1623049 [Ramaria rubella]|nr:hypothetical protein K439DRAFT_1623049 [Ramaria rubella]
MPLCKMQNNFYEPVEIPSACMLSQDVQEVFVVSQQEVVHVLQEYPGKPHLGVDGWAVPNVFLFLGITVTCCLGASLVTMILDFIWCIAVLDQSTYIDPLHLHRLTTLHTGIYLTEKLAECLKSYGIQKKINNVSNNTMILESLEFKLEGFQGMLTHFTLKWGSLGSSRDPDGDDGEDESKALGLKALLEPVVTDRIRHRISDDSEIGDPKLIYMGIGFNLWVAPSWISSAPVFQT